ncbi:MAG: hypothetical protein Q8P18_17105 [Pseudomonadota bacterium]|nr:hypothetical protein [Pseudomonadota bacterium]
MTDPVVRDHLLHVVTTLRAASVPDLSQEQRSARAQALVQLDVYARTGQFPRPDAPVVTRARRIAPPRAFRGRGSRAPIFEDRAGVRCAVGHLLGLARPDLVARVRDTDNGAHLPELDLPELDDWARASGLSRDELAWIQPSYCWEVPECDEVTLTAPPSEGQACDGADASLHSSIALTECQECNGTFKVWAWVTNRGTETADAVTVTLGAGEETFDQADGGPVLPGQVVQIGPLEADSVTCMNGEGWLRVSTPGENCDGSDEVRYWDYGNGGPGHVEPEACGGGCSDTGAPLNEDDAPSCDGVDEPDVEETGCGTGCGDGSAALLWVGLLGAGARRRFGAAR